MNFLPMYTQEKNEEISKDNRFKKNLCVSKISKGEFLDLACLHNKIVIYKNKFLIAYGLTGTIERISLIFEDESSIYKGMFKMDEDMSEQGQEIPEFEYIVCLDGKTFVIFKLENEELEVFQLASDVKIGVFVEASNVEDNNLIYACYLYDGDSKLFIKDVTTNSNTADSLYALFNAFCIRKEGK